MTKFREIAGGLKFPEGPIAMPDGSVIVVEIARGTLTRVKNDGTAQVIADLGGGPNGAAIGPDGAVYVCNNGGFHYGEAAGLLVPGDRSRNYSGGRIERVEPGTGKVDVLYTECSGHKLNAPNDIVFDSSGGFWFTDYGHDHDRVSDRGAVYYAKPDGSMIREVIFPLHRPNGIGLSADESTLYVAETFTCRLWGFPVSAPGDVDMPATPLQFAPIYCSPTFKFFDSLAVDGAGRVCVASILEGGISVISPDDGSLVESVTTGDPLTTNICFGGHGLKTAYITCSGTGRLLACDWPKGGQKLNFLNS
ncbi:MAG: SMP-30/gluconolactonase/LRE family protein [Alphaproteobacteria bacterium]